MSFLLRALLLAPLAFPAVAAAQVKIASLNLCMDQILLNWVAPEKIVSVTWLSNQDQYRRAPLPEHVYLNRAQAEELIPLKPDLILTGQFGAQRAADRLRSLGFEVVKIPDAYSLEQIQQQLDALQQALGNIPALEKEQLKLQRLLESTAKSTEGNKPTALILSANNITYGSGMLEHQLLTRAGFRNLAAEQGVQQLGRVSLEQVIAAGPDLLVFYGGEQDFAIAHLAERHPVLRHYFERERIFRLPAALGFCPALATAEVLQQLIDKRGTLAEVN